MADLPVCKQDCECNEGYGEVQTAEGFDCELCSVGFYSNLSYVTSVSSQMLCMSCEEGEYTLSEGSVDSLACICKPGYSRDCKTNICQPCAATELSFDSTCQPCPQPGGCDGSAILRCNIGSYQTDNGLGGMPSCQACPDDGATCKDDVLTAKVAGSFWVYEALTEGGPLLARVQSCPLGYSLSRSQSNPLGDSCTRCPPGLYNLDGSVWLNQDTSSEQFCKPCPNAGADCPVR